MKHSNGNWEDIFGPPRDGASEEDLAERIAKINSAQARGMDMPPRPKDLHDSSFDLIRLCL